MKKAFITLSLVLVPVLFYFLKKPPIEINKPLNELNREKTPEEKLENEVNEIFTESLRLENLKQFDEAIKNTENVLDPKYSIKFENERDPQAEAIEIIESLKCYKNMPLGQKRSAEAVVQELLKRIREENSSLDDLFSSCSKIQYGSWEYASGGADLFPSSEMFKYLVFNPDLPNNSFISKNARTFLKESSGIEYRITNETTDEKDDLILRVESYSFDPEYFSISSVLYYEKK